jgi:hypothetical protein
MSESIDSGVFHDYAFAIADAENAECLPEGLATERLAPKILLSSAHLMPMLVDLKRSPAATLDALFELVRNRCHNTEQPPIALFIKTNASAKELWRHWNVMQVAQPQPGRKLWLRLHDPRVLHQLLRILDPMQRQKLFGLSFEFKYWIGGEWITSPRSYVDRAQTCLNTNGSVELYAGPTRWDWHRIERISLVNRALQQAKIGHAEMLSSSGALAEQLMNRAAERYYFSTQSDLVEFAKWGLMINPTFDEHPAVSPYIKPDNRSSGQTSLSDRLSLIEECVWNELLQTKTYFNGAGHE